MSDVIISIEAGRTRSWVDPIGAAELASAVQRDLCLKFRAIKARGGKVYFVTLTYDPATWLPEGVIWKEATTSQREQAAEACWDAMTRDRHVHNFIDRLEEETGLDLSARWWSKREFTKNGFLHHHLIVDGPEFLPFDQVYHCWGFGRIDAQVARSEDGLAWYVGKYCTKYGDEPPAFIYNRPSGSLRFTTCSDGWWSSDLGPVRPARRAVPGVVKKRRTDREEDKLYGCYETVGMRIARKSRSVTVRCNGEREEVQGVTLEEFRRHRHHTTERGVIKARRSMDALVGLSLSQACRELRDIAAYVRSQPSDDLRASRHRPTSVFDAGPVPGSSPSSDPLTSLSTSTDPSVALSIACGSEEKRRHRGGTRPPEALPRFTGKQLTLYSQYARSRAEGGELPAISGPSSDRPKLLPGSGGTGESCPRLGERSEAQAGDASVSGVACGSLILSSPQECSDTESVISPVEYVGVPPDPL